MRCRKTQSAITNLLEQLAHDANDFDDEALRDGASGVVQRGVAALPRCHDEGSMLAEAARQAGIGKARFVRPRLPAEAQPFRGKDRICDIDER